MQHHISALIILNDIQNILANQVRALNGSTVGELYASLRAEGSCQVPFRGLGAFLAKEEDVVFWAVVG